MTEPNAGSDTTQLRPTAVRQGDRYVVNGQKIFISRVHIGPDAAARAHDAVRQVKKTTDGLSVFLVDLREPRKGIESGRSA